ncbi:hypothetical protein FPV67DRAFT_1087668 [Lyophyllum atratum]|nr:hypothetical protein FPV67DRAFT_1087668 [Lyophyllum atratum]
MAGAFSGHLVDSFHAQQARYSVPFGSQNQLITSGPMSFNPQMHGTPSMGNQSMGDYSFSFNSPHSTFNPELSEATTLKIAALQAKLNQKLGPEYISQRPGPGGGPKLTYAEGWKIINLANEVFGFNGWSSNVVSLTTDFIDYNEESRRYNVGTTAIIRVTLRDGVYHEDIGYGLLENSKSKGAALDKCKKEAVTDGLKRALRSFGNLLGNCLYDKTYTQEVVKIKVQAPKFDQRELHRRPEFEDTKPNIASISKPTHPSITESTTNSANNFVTPTRPVAHSNQQQTKVLSSIPPHLRSGTNAQAGPSHVARTTTNNNDTPMHSASKGQFSSGAASNQGQGRQTAEVKPNIRMPVTDTARPAIPQQHITTGGRNIISAAPGASIIPQPAPRPADPLPQPQEAELDAADESYHFYSDDDAFLALVDLGEGDLGQPLLPETDLGRPLDDDGGDTSFNTSVGGGTLGGGRQVSPADSSSTHAQKTHQHPPGQQSTRLNSLPQNQRQPPNQPHLPSNQFNAAPRPPQPQAANQNQPRQNHHQPPRNHNQNPQNQNHQPISGGPASTGKRPPTPSMGGFHFPPGIDLQADSSKQSAPAQGQSSTSVIGLKRPLEAM